MEKKATYVPNAATLAAAARQKKLGQHFRLAMLDDLYKRKFAPLAGPLKRICDMTGAEVTSVVAAMHTLSTMPSEARDLARVGEEVGNSRVVKKVLTQEQFVALCTAPAGESTAA